VLFRSHSFATLAVALALLTGGLAHAQATKRTPSATGTSKHFCQPEGGFCFNYPAGWTMLGEAFGAGVVVAPQQTTDRKLWDVVTVAAVELPTLEDGAALSIDQIIDAAMSNMRAGGHDPQTLQRQQLVVDTLPAEMIKVRYHDKESARDWIEQLVFIEGADQEIYSLSLKAQPASIGRLQPAFDGIVQSWKLQTSDNATSSPASPSTAKPATSAHPTPHN
jgi:hypothetical protein